MGWFALRSRSATAGAALVALLVSSPGWTLAEPAGEGVGGVSLPPGWDVEQEVRGELDAGVTGHVLVLVSQKADATDEHPRMLLVLEEAPGGRRQVGRNENLLLCVECAGAIGGSPQVSIERHVLIVKQVRGSREAVGGTWRFRREKQAGRMRLIGLDVRKWDRATGAGTLESTNYLTGGHVEETVAYDRAKDKDVVTRSERSTVSAAKLYLEDVVQTDLD